MLAHFSRNWWLFVLHGVEALLFGTLAAIWPHITIAFLTVLFGVYAFTDGFLAMVAALTNYAGTRRWGLLLGGLGGIAVGLLTLVWPNATGMFLLYLIAAWAILIGGLEILAAIELYREISYERLLMLSGIFSVTLGLLTMLFPSAGVLRSLGLIAAYAALSGVLLIALGLRIRSLAQEMPHVAAY